MIKQAVILAGGRGERLGPITDVIPKPMVEVAGRPFLYYLTKILQDIGIEDIVVSVGPLKEKFNLNGVRYSEAKPVVNNSVLSISNLQDLFMVVNGDCLPIIKWRQFINTDKPRVALKFKNGAMRNTGVCIVSKKQVKYGLVDCGNMSKMVGNSSLDTFVAYGNLHIGTQEGLERADKYLREFWRGR